MGKSKNAVESHFIRGAHSPLGAMYTPPSRVGNLSFLNDYSQEIIMQGL